MEVEILSIIYKSQKLRPADNSDHIYTWKHSFS